MNKFLLINFCLLLFQMVYGQNKNWSTDFNANYYSLELQFATLKIEVYSYNLIDRTKIDTSSGTAFIFSFVLDSTSSIPVLITNKHVVDGGIRYSFFITRKDEKGNPEIGKFDTISFSPHEFNWTPHPNLSIDLCAIPLLPILKKYSKSKYGYFAVAITEDDLPTKEEINDLKGIENIYMYGYPIGLWDSKNNLPIIREGITATQPFLDFQGAPIFLIDAACFPGSSGSPVFIINEGTYSTRSSMRMGKRKLFLGVLYAGPSFEPDGVMRVIDIPDKKEPIFIQSIQINLGYCIKSGQVIEFKRIFLSK